MDFHKSSERERLVSVGEEGEGLRYRKGTMVDNGVKEGGFVKLFN